MILNQQQARKRKKYAVPPSKELRSFDALPKARPRNSGERRKARGPTPNPRPKLGKAKEKSTFAKIRPRRFLWHSVLDSCWDSCSGSDKWIPMPRSERKLRINRRATQFETGSLRSLLI